MPMSDEYALLQLMLQQPNLPLEARRRGLRKKHFRNADYGKAFNLIYATREGLNSVPTEEELGLFSVKNEKIQVEQSFDHLLENIKNLYNIRTVKDTIINAAKELNRENKDDENQISLEEITKNVVEDIKNLADFSEQDKYQTISDANTFLLEKYKNRAKAREEGIIYGTSTGFEFLDAHFEGIQKSWFGIIAARGGIGKTWILIQMAKAALEEGKNVLFFSYEMNTNEVMERFHAIGAQINTRKLAKGELSPDEYSRLLEHIAISEKIYGKLHINDNPGKIENITHIIEDINAKNPEHPIDAIYIDGIYNMDVGKFNSGHEMHFKIAQHSKETIAKRYNVSVVGTHQMNREFAKINENKDKVDSSNHTMMGGDGYLHHADFIITVNKNEESFKAFHLINGRIAKFRHGEQDIDFYIRMNVSNAPLLATVDYNIAKAELDTIVGSAPKHTQKANSLIDATIKTFEKNQEYNKLIIPDVEF